MRKASGGNQKEILSMHTDVKLMRREQETLANLSKKLGLKKR
jgi:hypothetical protein